MLTRKKLGLERWLSSEEHVLLPENLRSVPNCLSLKLQES